MVDATAANKHAFAFENGGIVWKCRDFIIFFHCLPQIQSL
jgi:hypothetical protein